MRCTENSRNKTVSLETKSTCWPNTWIWSRYAKNEFTYAIKVSEDIHQEETEIPSMLIQPYVENAIIHGISHLSVPGHVEIVFELQGQLIICIITDNGVGRKSQWTVPFTQGRTYVCEYGSHRTKTSCINGPIRSNSGQEFIDLYDDDGKAADNSAKNSCYEKQHINT